MVALPTQSNTFLGVAPQGLFALVTPVYITFSFKSIYLPRTCDNIITDSKHKVWNSYRLSICHVLFEKAKFKNYSTNELPLTQKANVEYKIPCFICPVFYVGQTGRLLRTRLSLVERSRNLQHVLDHVWQGGHQTLRTPPSSYNVGVWSRPVTRKAPQRPETKKGETIGDITMHQVLLGVTKQGEQSTRRGFD